MKKTILVIPLVFGCASNAEVSNLYLWGSEYRMIDNLLVGTAESSLANILAEPGTTPEDVCVSSVSEAEFQNFRALMQQGKIVTIEKAPSIDDETEIRIQARDGTYLAFGGRYMGHDVDGTLYQLSEKQYYSVQSFSFQVIEGSNCAMVAGPTE